MGKENKPERRCLNRQCSYHKAGKCTLFPGWSFLDCRSSGIVTKADKPKPTKKDK